MTTIVLTEKWPNSKELHYLRVLTTSALRDAQMAAFRRLNDASETEAVREWALTQCEFIVTELTSRGRKAWKTEHRVVEMAFNQMRSSMRGTPLDS